MSEPPLYVTWHCPQCSGGVEFNAHELTAENKIVPCPHCGTNIELHVPAASPAPENRSVGTDSAQYGSKRAKLAKGPRVALTPKQCATPTGKELVDLLCDVARDGLVSVEGMMRLRAWLDKRADSDIPAIKFLLQTSDRVLYTGKVTTTKAFEMHFAIERVLPKNIRSTVKEKRQEAWLHSPLKAKAALGAPARSKCICPARAGFG